MSPAALLQAAATIYALPSYQGIPMTPTIAVDIARRMAKDIERFEQVYSATAHDEVPQFGKPGQPIGAAHGVADQEEDGS